MPLEIQLDPIEARVFGVLIEKALTTPDQYPLSLNAATNGCNQKANRDPVLSLEEDQVGGALYRLQQKYMAREVFPGASRVTKYVHNGKDALGVEIAGLAVIAELLMRGPQMPGELRARASRMAQPNTLDTLEQLSSVLGMLIEKGYVQRLPPAPGSRAERYVQLLSPDLHPIEQVPVAYSRRDDDDEPPPTTTGAPTLSMRVAALEQEVAALREQVRLLSERLQGA